jgi:hypothetical protein
MAVTDAESKEVEIYVINDSNGERVESSYKLKEEEKK